MYTKPEIIQRFFYLLITQTHRDVVRVVLYRVAIVIVAEKTIYRYDDRVIFWIENKNYN